MVPLLLIKRYAYDLELLAVGAEFGFDRIEEIPVKLDYRFGEAGSAAPRYVRMFVDTLAIAYRIHLRHWYVRRHAALERQRTDALAHAEVLEEDRIVPPAGTLDVTDETRRRSPSATVGHPWPTTRSGSRSGPADP